MKIKEVHEFTKPYAGENENTHVSAFLIIDWKNKYVILSCPTWNTDPIRNIACIQASIDAKSYAFEIGLDINEYVSHE